MFENDEAMDAWVDSHSDEAPNMSFGSLEGTCLIKGRRSVSSVLGYRGWACQPTTIELGSGAIKSVVVWSLSHSFDLTLSVFHAGLSLAQKVRSHTSC